MPVRKKVSKEVKRDVKKDVKRAAKFVAHPHKKSNGRKHGGNRGASARGTFDDKQGALDTAFCVLNPDAAADYDLNPGVCDSQLHNDDIVFTKTRFQMTAMTPGTGAGYFVARCVALPYFNLSAAAATAFYNAGTVSATTQYSDVMYSAAGTQFNYYTCIGMCMTARCLDKPLDLNGTRQFIAGTLDTFLSSSHDTLAAREDSLLMGNNKAGDILRGLWIPKEPFELRAMSDSGHSSVNNGAIVFQMVTANASLWEIEITRVFACQNTTLNTLVPKRVFVGNAAIYSEAVAMSFAKEGLYSQARCVYSDDGWFSNLWSDVKDVLGSAGKAAWGAAKPLLSKAGAAAMGAASKSLFGATAAAMPIQFQTACALSLMPDDQLQIVWETCREEKSVEELKKLIKTILEGAQSWRDTHGYRADTWPTLDQLAEHLHMKSLPVGPPRVVRLAQLTADFPLGAAYEPVLVPHPTSSLSRR